MTANEVSASTIGNIVLVSLFPTSFSSLALGDFHMRSPLFAVLTSCP